MAQYLEWLDFHRGGSTLPDPKTEPFSGDLKDPDASWLNAEVEVSVATYQAYQILYYSFIALFAIAGFDKFLRLLTAWETYASPGIAGMFGVSVGALSILAGIVELGIAAAVALKPRIGSWAATVWLWLVAVNLLATHGHADLVLMTLALSASGFAFIRLSAECN